MVRRIRTCRESRDRGRRIRRTRKGQPGSRRNRAQDLFGLRGAAAMNRLRVMGCLVLLGCVAFAQQTPVRVRLMSLYSLQQITVTPVKNTSVSWGKASTGT